MAGFTTDYVNLIANNLRDRYKSGFPILKELVQNADDAGATELAFGYHQGLGAEADHPLLQGPALWVLNNGRFNERDRKAIHAFGLNSKAAESAAIGKFGLGMKSVFHLCESYFYVAFDGIKLYREILNPWMQDANNSPMHERWETITERDLDCLVQTAQAQPESQSAKTWFLLWVPLRTHVHVAASSDKRMAAIIERYPGESEGADLDFFTEPVIDQRIGALLPMLRSLEQVRFDGAPSLKRFKIKLALSEGAKRLDHATDGITVAGLVIDDRPRNEQLHFYGQQFAPVGNDTLASLLKSPSWPSSIAILEDGTRGQVPDKARAEGAVLIGHADNRAGRLVLQWAVFLPTEEIRSSFEAYIPNSSREYRIVLHGQFFVDAGRRGIEDMDVLHQACTPLEADALQPQVLRSWNQTLAQQVILPRLLESVAQYAKATKLKDDEIREFTKALQESATGGGAGRGVPFFSTFRSYLCGNHAWLRQLRRTGPEWSLVHTGPNKFLPLPLPANNDYDRPWRALPGLDSLHDVILFDYTAPKLAPEADHWEASLLLKAIGNISQQVLKSTSDLEYLVLFLEMDAHREIHTSQVQEELVLVLRRVLQQTPFADLRANRSLFKRLVSVLQPARRFGLGTRDPSAKGALQEAIYQRLVIRRTSALLLPGDLAPDAEDVTTLPAEADLNSWLQGLGEEVHAQSAWKESNIEPLLEIAESLIKSAGDRDAQAAFVRTNASIRVLRATDVRTGKLIAASLNALCATHQAGNLFRRTNPRDPLGLTKVLCAALPQQPVQVIGSMTAQFLLSAYDDGLLAVPAHDDESAMFRAVGGMSTAPILGNVEARKALLAYAGGADLDDAKVVRGLRYLLHGSAAHYADMSTLWRDPTSRQSPWVRLWRMLSDVTWNVLADDVCGCISNTCLDKLKVQPVDDQSVIKRLQAANADFSRIRPEEFHDEDRDQVLGRVHIQDAWCRLPLHRDTAGRFGPVDASCYVGVGPALPLSVGHNLRFIEPSHDAAHAQNQRNWIANWTVHAAVRTVLATTNPTPHWRFLLDRLVEDDRLFSGPPAEWMRVRWLPLRNQSAIALDSLISLGGLEHDIAILAEKCDFAFAGVNDLSEELRKHPGFGRLAEQINQGEEALPAFGQMMGAANLWVGRASTILSNEAERLWPTLSRLTTVPAWALLEKAAQESTYEAVATHVLPNIAVQLPTDHAQAVLEDLQRFDLDPGVLQIYSAYLQEWVNSGNPEVLKRRLATLSLPSTVRTWEPAASMTFGVMGVDKSRVLDADAARTLHPIIAVNGAIPDMSTAEPEVGGAEWSESALINDLEAAFEPFAQGTAQAAAAAVIGLFGQATTPLATKWLGAIAYSDYLNHLGWRDPGHEDGLDRRLKWMGGKSVTQALATLKPVLKVVTDGHVQVLSVIGELIEVRLLSVRRLQTLLAGAFRWLGGNGVIVSLRDPAILEEYGPDEQKVILRRTAEEMLVHLYNQPHADLSTLWGLFENADQVTLDVACDLILDGLPQFLRQLGRASRNPRIAAALAEMDRARRDLASAKQAGRDLRQPQQIIDASLTTLSTLVETDEQVQSTLLDCIRERVTQNQYEISSIPFELFQNADDAVFELLRLYEVEGRGVSAGTEIGYFVMHCSDRGARFMHWGRPINYTGRSAEVFADYANDLERMLMLGASSKLDERVVTGKFGLGFKSVLLATDRPKIWSGDLRFEILGGCLPRRWTIDTQTRQYQQQQQDLVGKPWRSTLVELPLVSEEKAQELAGRFAALAGLSVIFSRQIRRINVDDSLHVWSPQLILEEHDCQVETGDVRVPTRNGFTTSRLLVLRYKNAALALRLDAGGVIAFDHAAEYAAPSIWVTTPTRGCAAKGMLLNADFEIDTGRASLAHGQAAMRNRERVRKLAERFAAPVARLQEKAEEDWATLAGELGCSRQPTAAGFWFGFWQTLFAADAEAGAAEEVTLAAAFVEHLFDRTLARTGRLANGMEGDAAAFVDLLDLTLSIPRERFTEVLPALQKWPLFVKHYPASSWCADEVAQWIDRSCADRELEISTLNAQLVMSVLNGGQLGPESVSHLAAVLAAWANKTPNLLEEQSWRNALAGATCLSRAAKWNSVRHLLHSRTPHAELLERFAPSSAVLDSEYEKNDAAWNVLVQYLPSFQVTEQLIVSWCLSADGQDARRGAVSWLVRNQHGYAMTVIRHCRPQGGWLFDLTVNDPVLEELFNEDRVALLTKLDVSTEEDDPAVAPLGAQLSLPLIWEWWQDQRTDLLERYDKQLWPEGFDRTRLADENVDREAWMTLFSVAVFRRYGRTTDVQHKAFLQFLDTHGWWQTICHADPENAPDEWMAILRAYGEKQLASTLFEQWMDSFPRLYRLARWLDDYVHLFTTIDLRNEQHIAELLTPAIDASLNGSGIDAPTLSGMLRLGRHLVVRELLRSGVLESPLAESLAYMPRGSVLALLEQMGYDGLTTGQDIHLTLVNVLGEDGARFEGDYDIPLQMIAISPALQHEILEWSSKDEWEGEEAA